MAKPKLGEYERKRKFGRTPEPRGRGRARRRKSEPRFVIQEHHARRIHWDLRLERDGVLASWALPRGVPPTPKDNRLAVRTEDHPLEYLEFEGEIPRGEYGAGTMRIWDRGTYAAEKFADDKVIVDFRGERVSGRYALFPTKPPNWMIHRMDPPAEPEREPLPSEALLDGEVVAFDEAGRPDFQLLQRRMHLASDAAVRRRMADTPATYLAFDVLHLDGRSLLELPYGERREGLDELDLGSGPHLQAPANHRGDGRKLLELTRERGLEGLVAKRLDSTYQPGRRSRAWIKVKNVRTTELVIGGLLPGQGGRTGRIGALLVGYYDDED